MIQNETVAVIENIIFIFSVERFVWIWKCAQKKVRIGSFLPLFLPLEDLFTLKFVVNMLQKAGFFPFWRKIRSRDNPTEEMVTLL